MIELSKKIEGIEAYVSRFISVDRQSIGDFVAHSREKNFKKNELFLREGDICGELLFVHQGRSLWPSI